VKKLLCRISCFNTGIYGLFIKVAKPPSGSISTSIACPEEKSIFYWIKEGISAPSLIIST